MRTLSRYCFTILKVSHGSLRLQKLQDAFHGGKAAERHPDCLVSSCQCSVARLKNHGDAIQSVVVQFCKVRHESLQLQEFHGAFYGG